MATVPVDHPVHRRPLEIREAPVVSDHGLPLSAGLLGATVWGDGRPLKLSLDRGDVWDLRPVEEFSGPEYTWTKTAEAHRAGRHDDLSARLEKPYHRPGPTKLPAGRIELTYPAAAELFRLDRARALAEVRWTDGARLQAFIDERAGRMRGAGPQPAIRLEAPPFGGRPEGWVEPKAIASFADVWELGYPPPTLHEAADAHAYVQEGWGGFAFAVAVAWRSHGEAWEAAWVIEVRQGESTPALLARALEAARAAVAEGFEDALVAHESWWADYWARGRVDLPDPEVEDVYYSAMSLFGQAARKGAPSAPLQGPWTTDNGRLPPWKGDYHHDLNTEMTYWPAYAAGHLDASQGFVDWLWDTRAECERWTRAFFEVEGLNVPMTADIHNRQMGGWRQYSHSPSISAWLAHHVWLHWRYTQDEDFLRARAHPYLSAVCRYIEAITEARDAEGRRSLLLSSSPEVNDNKPEAWFDSLTNYDLTLFLWALEAGADLAEAVGEAAEAARWRHVAAEFPPLALGEDGALLITRNVPLAKTHRHFSHLMALHPLGLLQPLDRPDDARIVEASLAQLERLGTKLWMGYSFSWHALLLARAGKGEAAARSLRIFQQAFTYPNGFHTNGDWRDQGHSIAFGAFTLEGNSAAGAAVHEMLLQSRPGVLRLFPAIPPSWSKVSFERLFADGGLEVSARWDAGRLAEARIRAPKPLDLRIALGSASLRPVKVSAGETRLTHEDLDAADA